MKTTTAERDHSNYCHAKRLALYLYERDWKSAESGRFEVFPTMAGVLEQIDNMIAGTEKIGKSKVANSKEIAMHLNDAMHEIKSLRRENELLRAKTETMDAFMTVLRVNVYEKSQPMGIDVYWQLNELKEKLNS